MSCKKCLAPKQEDGFKKSARERGYEFALTLEHFSELVFGNCYYCGVSPVIRNGVNRVDNGGGYTPENVITACVTCNFAKGDLPLQDFKQWILRAAEHMGGY